MRAKPGGHLRLPTLFLSLFTVSVLFAQDKMLPMNRGMNPQPDAWDVRYRDLEPQLERQLTETPD